MANKRLIDAKEMKNNIMEAMMRQFEKNGDQIALRIGEMMCHFIDVTDTVDAVEVVRCKDCKWGGEKESVFHPGYITCDIGNLLAYVKPDGFCSCGERRNK